MRANGAELEVWACDDCGHAVYPRRFLCPRCASPRLRPVPAEAGIVQEATERRHRLLEDKREAHGDWRRLERVRLVSVLTDAGPVVTARALEQLDPGTRVRLGAESGAPVARRASDH